MCGEEEGGGVGVWGVLLCNAYTVEVLLTQTLRSRSLRPGTRRERNTELEYPFLKLLSFVFSFSVFWVHVSRALTKTVPPECGGEGEDGGGGEGGGRFT